MRHSSWTLFLVPLALPLVFLVLPGSWTGADQTGDTTLPVEEPYEAGWEMPTDTDGPEADTSGEGSGILFRG